MKRLLIFSVVIVMALTAMAGAVQAQQSPAEIGENPYVRLDLKLNYKGMYNRYAIQAKGWDQTKPGYPVGQLTRAYTGSIDYDPFAEDTKAKLYECAYQALEGGSLEEKTSAADRCAALIDAHLANYDIVTAAIPLARQDARLGDVKFLSWMRGLLIERVMASGDGLSVKTPYVVYSVGEEGVVLARKKLKILESENLNTDTAYFRIHFVEDAKTGRQSRLYLDLTIPMLRSAENKKLSDPRNFELYEPTPVLE